MVSPKLILPGLRNPGRRSACNSEADPPEMQHSRQKRPWDFHAREQDDGSCHKLPQIKDLDY